MIDPRTYQIVNTVTVPGGVHVRAVDGGAIVWQAEPLRVWALSHDDLAAIVSLDDVAPLLETEGRRVVTTTFDDEVGDRRRRRWADRRRRSSRRSALGRGP